VGAPENAIVINVAKESRCHADVICFLLIRASLKGAFPALYKAQN